MNALFVDAVTKAKSQVTGSIPADRAVARVNALDWQEIGDKLDQQGSALIQDVLSPAECEALVALYSEESIFRSRVVMGRHGFGRGEYKYFNYPLPDLVQGLRTMLFAGLARIAIRWNAVIKIKVRYPDRHDRFLQKCHDGGQTQPTPLLLQSGKGDFN